MSITESELERVEVVKGELRVVRSILAQFDAYHNHPKLYALPDTCLILMVALNTTTQGVKIILQSRIIELDAELREYVK